MSKVFVGVGSNLGDREFLIRKAVESMRDLPRTLVVRVSSLYDTDPVGEVDQPAFLNAVVWLETTLEPRELLWQLLLIEKRMGRVRSQIEMSSCRLLETLAEELALALIEEFDTPRVRVHVRKLHIPVRDFMTIPEVIVERGRS